MTREDLYVRHQIELAQLTKGELELLGKRFKDLRKGVARNLSGFGPLQTWSKERVETQLALISGFVDQFFDAVENETAASYATLASMEAVWNTATLAAVSTVAFTPTSGSAVVQAVLSEPFQGQLHSQWFGSLSQRTQEHIATNIRQAWATGETLKSVEKRLDPVMRAANQNTAAIVRSGIMDVAATAREQTYIANAEHISFIIWTATLDARTSMPCRLRDGKIYTVDGKPHGHKIPFGAGPGKFHWGCRSTSVPVLKGEKPEAMVEEFTRPSFDYNKETKTRAESTLRYDTSSGKLVKKGERNPDAERRGQPTQTTSRYPEWFARQPAWVQDKVLGKRKGALYRSGGLQLSTFSEDGARALTLAELKEKGYQL